MSSCFGQKNAQSADQGGSSGLAEDNPYQANHVDTEGFVPPHMKPIQRILVPPSLTPRVYLSVGEDGCVCSWDGSGEGGEERQRSPQSVQS